MYAKLSKFQIQDLIGSIVDYWDPRCGDREELILDIEVKDNYLRLTTFDDILTIAYCEDEFIYSSCIKSIISDKLKLYFKY